MFVRGSDGWASARQAKLTASDAANFNHLGLSVAVSADGSRVAAGSPNATVGAMAQGAVYLFARGATGVWAGEFEFKKLWAPDGAAGAHLGTSVAVSGDQLAVAGAPNATLSMNANQGAAYVFQDVLGTGWQETAKLTVAGGAQGDQLGSSVATSGGTVVAGAPFTTVSTQASRGAAYVFVRPDNALDRWTDMSQTARLTASNGKADDLLGTSVGVSKDGSVAVAGAPTNAGRRGTGLRVPVRPLELGLEGYGRSDAVDGLRRHDRRCDRLLRWLVLRRPRRPSRAAWRAAIGGHMQQGAAYVFTDSTSTSVDCQPASLVLGQTSSCTATVTDTGSTAATPTGPVSFTTDSPGSFGARPSCTLAPTASAGTASCRVGYTPSTTGSGTHTISAAYGGDGGHTASLGVAHVAVSLATTSISVSCQQPVGDDRSSKPLRGDCRQHGSRGAGAFGSGRLHD